MKSYYSIIKVVSNILSHDSISVGLVLSDENKMIVQFSERKVNLANRLIDIEKNALSYFLKQISNVINEQNDIIEKNKDELFESPISLDYNYFRYLYKYSNNIIQFTEPKYIKGKCDNDLFGEVFKLFIDKKYGKEILEISDCQIEI